uniref:Uncharacterized protein n=1 Tax=Peronospora matthiolae TaxID=2874970 RepID=A0AAV1TJA8_9STRA
MADADLFGDLPLDCVFLEGRETEAVAAAAAGHAHALGANGSSHSAMAAAAASMDVFVPDDQMLLDSDVPGSSPTNMMTPKTENEDFLTPLSFSFIPNGVAAVGGPTYRVAPQHKHKRVRSNPDVLQGFGMATTAHLDMTSPASMRHEGLGFLQPQRNEGPLGLVPMRPSVPPVDFARRSAAATAAAHGESFEGMDAFLQEMAWSELNSSHHQQQLHPQHVPSGSAAAIENYTILNGEVSPVVYRTQRIQEGVNELKMKRKRPASYHLRHHSNPVDLLHNLDQFRILADQSKDKRVQQQVQQQQQHQQQQHQQQQHQQQSNQGYLNSPADLQDPSMFLEPLQQNLQHFQFQVPSPIASGAVHSLHGRRSSLGSTLPPRAAARRRGGANRPSGLSMDMSQMNLEFLSVPEEPSNPDLDPCGLSTAVSSFDSKKVVVDDANRKMYKCGRCGQPKVGHICTMPDQRNNWTQVDLEVTKGLKIMRSSCHIMPVKSKWKVQCNDHEPVQLVPKGDVKHEFDTAVNQLWA